MGEVGEEAMIIAITGGRDYDLTNEDKFWLGSQCGKMEKEPGPHRFIHGDAKGVDQEVGAILEHYGYEVGKHPADWKNFGKIAGFLRNRYMAKGCDRLWAFPGGRGTQHMIDQVKALSKPVEESPSRSKL